ncbi:MAG: methyl-accepting chemotaxis protein [Deltaproteobacteria bacterium]|nr:methyl-accepting chemotaxis protein [Deltaproteobacteria bacterium]
MKWNLRRKIFLPTATTIWVLLLMIGVLVWILDDAADAGVRRARGISITQVGDQMHEAFLHGNSAMKDLFYAELGEAGVVKGHLDTFDERYLELVGLVGEETEDALRTELAAHLDTIQQLRGRYQESFDRGLATPAEAKGAATRLAELAQELGVSLDAFHDRAVWNLEELRATDKAIQQRAFFSFFICLTLLIVVSTVATWRVSKVVTKGVDRLIDRARKIAEGDLRVRVEVETSDELADLAAAFNEMTDELQSMAQGVNDAAHALNATIGEMSSTVAEQAASLEQQAAAVTETVATVEEITRTAHHVSETASGVVGSASSSVEVSDSGKTAVSRSIEGMMGVRSQVEEIATTILDLSEKTQQIGSIIATVDDFAEQSSLLALNASIEAARAGEEGKAFSVVAGEVKNLAEQSRQATERVRAILSEIQQATHTAVMVTEEGSKRVERGVELIESAGTIVEELAVTLRGTADSARQIASAAQQQAGGVSQISTAMVSIEEFSRQNLLAVRQTEHASRSVAAISEQLEASAARYQTA